MSKKLLSKGIKWILILIAIVFLIQSRYLALVIFAVAIYAMYRHRYATYRHLKSKYEKSTSSNNDKTEIYYPPKEKELTINQPKTSATSYDPDKFLPKPPYICPYCNKDLPFTPKATRKCPFCSQKIHVKRTVQNPQKELMTEARAKEVEVEWMLNNFSNQYSEYITKTEIENICDQLNKKFNGAALSRDIKWAIYNHLIQKMLPKNDFQSLKMIYWEMARQLFEEGKDAFQLLWQSAKMDLLSHQGNSDIYQKVEILTTGDQSCPECQKLNGKIFTIKEALEKMPIPCKACSSELKENDNRSGWCRCIYSSVIDD